MYVNYQTSEVRYHDYAIICLELKENPRHLSVIYVVYIVYSLHFSLEKLRPPQFNVIRLV